MASRADPRQIAKLVKVQHARRAAAEAALAAARDAEMQARAREEAALDDVSVAQDDWLGFLELPGFAPDYARALAARLLAREAVAGEAREECRAADSAHLRCQEAWRLSEAYVKLTEASLARARRDAGRGREEKRLGDLSDRITYAWMRP